MTMGTSTRRTLVLATTFGSLLASAWPAAAQQRQPWQQGQPDTPAAAALSPIAPLPIPTEADKLPVGKLKLAKGFKLEVYASGIANARTLRQGDQGTIFVSNRTLDKVYAVVDKNGKREVKVIAQGLHRPNGIALHDGTLYIAELSQISKIDKIEDNLDNPPKPTVIYSDLPKDEPHGWKFLTVGPDNKLYFQVGAPCNNCMPSDAHAQIRRINLDGSGAEVVARGIRQIVGMDWHPTLKQLYFTENAIPTATRAISRIRSSAGAVPATNLPSRSACWARIRPHSACDSTLEARFRRNIAMRSSSRVTAPGTARRRSAATSSW